MARSAGTCSCDSGLSQRTEGGVRLERGCRRGLGFGVVWVGWRVSEGWEGGGGGVCFQERRVVATAADVRARTGHYYTRIFNGGDERYAEDSNATDLFCGVWKTGITPNLNSKNLQTEYRPYDPSST